MAAIQRPALPARSLPSLRRSPRLLIGLAAALVLGGAMLQVNQFSAVTTTGYHIEELERERAAKQAENDELEAEVARLASLARVDIEARVRLKMEPAQRILNIEVNQPVPDHQTLPTRFKAPGEPVRDAVDGSFIDRLLDLLGR